MNKIDVQFQPIVSKKSMIEEILRGLDSGLLATIDVTMASQMGSTSDVRRIS